MSQQIQFRRGTAAEWTSANPILAQGELGLEWDTGLTKIGNGSTAWNALQYQTLGNGSLSSMLLTAGVDPGESPVSTMRLYAKTIANRVLPKFVGPSGLDSALQPLLARNKIGYWDPPGNAATVPGILGYGTLTAAGTATSRSVAITNLFTRMRRIGFVSAATAASAGGARMPAAQVTVSDGLSTPSSGGFFKVVRFGIADAVLQTVARTFVGMSSSTAAPTNVEPSTLTNVIGMGHNASATTMSIFFGGSAAQTPIKLGADFPCNTTNTDVYELALFSPPNTTDVYYEVTRLNTGHVAVGTLVNSNPGVTLPSPATLLSYMQAWRNNNSAAVAVGLDIMSDYIETDY